MTFSTKTVATACLILGACGFVIASWLSWLSFTDAQIFPTPYGTVIPVYATGKAFLLALPSRFHRAQLAEFLDVVYSALLVLGPLGAALLAAIPSRRMLRAVFVWSGFAALSLVFAVYQEVVYLPVLYNPGIRFGEVATGPLFAGIGPGLVVFMGALACMGYAWRMRAAILAPAPVRSTPPARVMPRRHPPAVHVLWLAGALLWIAAYMAPFWVTTQCHGIIFMEPTCYGRIDPLDAWGSLFAHWHAMQFAETVLVDVNMLLAEGAVVIFALNLRQMQPDVQRKLLLGWQALATILTLGAAILIAPLINTIDASTGQRWVIMPGMPLALLGLAVTWVGAVWIMQNAHTQADIAAS